MKKPQLSELTLREKIGQCLCVPQFDVNNKTEVDRNLLRTPEERDRLVSEQQYGCVWCHGGQTLNTMDMAVLDWNLRVSSKDYRKWVEDIEKNLKIPMLRPADLELRGAGENYTDLTSVCEPMALGATGSEEMCFKMGQAIGKEMLCAGLNWRWGPVVDIANRFQTTGGIMRTFSQEPDKLIKLSNAYIRGVQSVGVAATAKHFPGGDRFEHRDAHFTSTTLFSTMEQWWSEQGRIFKEVINSGVYSVMTSHMAFPACDNTKINGKYIPVTISKKVTTDLLKGELGFKGVVVSDCINMGGIVSIYPHDKLIVEIMKAGNDMILSAGVYDAEILEKAVLSGELSESRIDDACQRVLDMKEKMGMFDDDYSIVTYESETVAPETKALNKEVARKAITLVRDENKMLPLDKSKIKNITVICSTHSDDFYSRLELLKQELEVRGMNVKMQRQLKSYAELEYIDKTSDLIIYAGYLAGHCPKGAISFFGEEVETFHFAFSYGNEKTIGVSFGYPYIHYDFMANANTFINTHGQSPELITAFVEGIFGETPIVGESPVPLKPEHDIW